MGKPTIYKNVRAASKNSIELRFAYPDPKTEQRERVKMQPTPANLKRAFAHLVMINDAIADGSFDYAKTFPNSKRAALYTNTGQV